MTRVRKRRWFRFLLILAGGCFAAALMGEIQRDIIQEAIAVAVVVVAMASYGLSVALPSGNSV